MRKSTSLSSNSRRLLGLAVLRAEQAKRKNRKKHITSWLTRLPLVYPKQFSIPFSDYHAAMWAWADGITSQAPPAFIAVWPRGSGKSTGAEVVPIEIGALGKRKYCWYIRETQDQADKSVENIGAILESREIAFYYPLMSERMITKYGQPKGWRRNRLVTAKGFTIDALGLDTAVRGVKAEENRPDLIILDDIDGRHDTLNASTRKIELITDSILPAGSTNVAVLAIQNLLIPDGVFAQLIDGRADFLLDRVVSGPHSAVEGLAYEQDAETSKYRVLSGEPTWPEGQGLEIVEEQINRWGPTAFLREAQHEVDRTGGMYEFIEFKHIAFDDLPELVDTNVWVDPAVTSKDSSDSMGINAKGIDKDGVIYDLYSWESITSPEKAIKMSIRKAMELGSRTVGVETDQGGDTWKSVYYRAMESIQADYLETYIEQLTAAATADGKKITERAEKNIEQGAQRMVDQKLWPKFEQDKAGAGYGPKIHRQHQMLADYERGKIVHVMGTHVTIEKALHRLPNKPLDLADAAWWAWMKLRRGSRSGIYL